MPEREPRADRSPPGDDEARVGGLIEAAGPRPPIPPEDLEAIAAAARSAWRIGVHRHRRAAAAAPRRRLPPAPTLALALAATIAAALGLGWWWAATRVPAAGAATVARVETVAGAVRVAGEAGEPGPLAAGDELPRGATVTTAGAGGAGAGRVSLRLAGGPTLRLDAGTELRLVSATAVELARGELYAATGPGEGRGAALEVRTPLGTARDVGTQFTVAVVGRGAESVRVRVREGAVVVERDGRSYRAAPGEELVVLRGDGVERREIPTHGDPWAWVLDAAPPFAGRTLADLLGWVERETGWRVRYESPELAESARRIVLYGGVGDLRPDEAPLAVLPGAGLEGEVEGGVLTVRRPR